MALIPESEPEKENARVADHYLNAQNQKVFFTPEEKAEREAFWASNEAIEKLQFEKEIREKQRIKAFGCLQEQINRLTKCLNHLAKNGLDLGVEGAAQCNLLKKVDADLPKL